MSGSCTVNSCRTLGGYAYSKVGSYFSCMCTSAVHKEVIKSMESSCFINALRRFLSICSQIKQIRTDHGTNFLGMCKELAINSKHCNDQAIQEFLTDNR